MTSSPKFSLIGANHARLQDVALVVASWPENQLALRPLFCKDDFSSDNTSFILRESQHTDPTVRGYLDVPGARRDRSVKIQAEYQPQQSSRISIQPTRKSLNKHVAGFE
jgi:hypothetical protein